MKHIDTTEDEKIVMGNIYYKFSSGRKRVYLMKNDKILKNTICIAMA